MYSTVIEIKKDATSDVLSQLKIVIENAFSNRVGTVKNVSKEPYHFEFTGDEKDYGCLEVGLLNLKKDKSILKFFDTWKWIDDDPDECCDVLKVFSTPVR